MDVIGNNIANINTIGFKSSRTTFSDMLSQVQRSASAPTEGRGGVNPRQIGLGVDLESIDLIFTDSSPQQTGKNTDLALSGNGLFVLKDGNQSFYTRNGAFMFDEQGYYVMPGNGLRVQGWNAADGVINTNGAATDVIVEVGKTMEATATDAINYNGNLNKQEPTIVKISYITAPDVDPATAFAAVGTGTTDNPTSINVDGVNVIAATITFSDGSDPLHVTSGYYEVGRTVPVTTLAEIYDSQGGRHEVTVLIDKDPTTADADANTEALETATTTASFYTDGDNGWNNVLLDGKKLNENVQYFYDNALSVSGAVHLDKDGDYKTSSVAAEYICEEEKYGGFVCFGDETDFAKLTVSQTSKVMFTLSATGDATLEIIKVMQNGEKYTKKSLQTVKYKAGSDPASSKKAVTLEVKDGVSYYVSVKATNTKKTSVDPKTYYNVSYALEPVEAAALSMPETSDALAMTDSLSFGQYDVDALADASASSLAELDDRSSWQNLGMLA